MIRIVLIVAALALAGCSPRAGPDCRPAEGGIGGTGAPPDCRR